MTMVQSQEWKKLGVTQRSIIDEAQMAVSVPVGEIARRLGLRIKVANLGQGISGQISCDNEGCLIRVSRFESKERQRFTIAHEIAHFLLHHNRIDESPNGITDTVLYRSPGKHGAPDPMEFEANRLAADILMPTGSVQKRLRELGGRVSDMSIEVLARDFKVPKAAMEIRLQNCFI